MSRWRRFWMFPLTRIVVGAVVFAAPQLVLVVVCHALGLEPTLVAGAAVGAVAALLALWVVGVVIEGRPARELLLAPGRRVAADTAWGFALGAALFTSVVLLLTFAGLAHIGGAKVPAPGGVALGFLAFLFVGISEEVLFRGLFFRVLEAWLGSWAALALSALLFGAVHLGNPNATLWAGLAIALEAGLLLAAFYMLTRSLVFVIGLHWAWNFFEGPIFGTAVSGGHAGASLLATTTSGPDAWTGGEFGPEASLVAVLVCAAVTVAALVLAAKHRQIRPPSWRRAVR
jgi:membrane protease YdiL (CAAX protease family)